MRRLIVALVVAVLGLTLINLFQGTGNRHSIEDDLTGRSERALAAAGIPAEVAFRGRDGTVTVAAGADRDRARAIVRDLTGVRVVSVAAPTPPDATAPIEPPMPSPSDPATSPSAPAPSNPAETSDPADPSDPASPAQPTPDEIQDRLRALPRVTFANNSAALTTSGRRVVADIAEILDTNPTVRLTIQGHTDSRGSAAANRTLSTARAGAVRDSLIAAGIAADRLTATGLGENRPKVPDTSEANRTVNRRVEFIAR